MSIITDNLPKVASIGQCGVCSQRAEVFSINGKLTCESCFDVGASAGNGQAASKKQDGPRTPVELLVPEDQMPRVGIPISTPEASVIPVPAVVDKERQELVDYIASNATDPWRKKMIRQLTAKLQHDIEPVLGNQRWFSLLDLKCYARELGYGRKGAEDYGLLNDAVP